MEHEDIEQHREDLSQHKPDHSVLNAMAKKAFDFSGLGMAKRWHLRSRPILRVAIFGVPYACLFFQTINGHCGHSLQLFHPCRLPGTRLTTAFLVILWKRIHINIWMWSYFYASVETFPVLTDQFL